MKNHFSIGAISFDEDIEFTAKDDLSLEELASIHGGSGGVQGAVAGAAGAAVNKYVTGVTGSPTLGGFAGAATGYLVGTFSLGGEGPGAQGSQGAEGGGNYGGSGYGGSGS